ncbi:hypothetical protein SDC9_186910 [bioreactor metagenome]|uniref:Uncharacterized protein n=1 Tax=bioreactor metagenome TaxID=1076179 RepID=A0A645HLR5_9ZZZZ
MRRIVNGPERRRRKAKQLYRFVVRGHFHELLERADHASHAFVLHHAVFDDVIDHLTNKIHLLAV